MRVYVGEVDETGRPRAWVAYEGERVDLADMVDVLGQLRALSDPVIGAELDRETVLARKRALIDQIEATGALPAPVELVHRGTHSPDGFAWGYPGSGPADLAESILRVEVGEDLGRDVYMRFRDDVIARLPHRTHFRLTSAQVGEWLATNRELVERAFLESPPMAAVVVGDIGVPATVGSESASGGADDGATASAVVSACEAAWADIRTHHPSLPDAVMILGSGVERGRLVKLGHWWGGRWLADGQVRGEVLLAGEALHLPADQVFEVLLHEAAHGLNAAAGVKDASRGGRYHNQHFAEMARRVLLHVRATPPYGLAGTTLTPEARERYAGTIERLGEEIRIARKLSHEAVAGAEGPGGPGGDGGRSGEDTDGKSRGSLAASCGCGRKLRMAPSVLAKGPVVCGLCGNEFSTGAEVGRARGADAEQRGVGRDPAAGDERGRDGRGDGGARARERAVGEDVPGADVPAVTSGAGAEAAEDSRPGVVDRSFVDRRQAAMGLDRRVGDVRAAVSRQIALLDAALGSTDAASQPLLLLRERRDRLAVVLGHLDANGSVRPVELASSDVPAAPTAGQEEAARQLAAEATADQRLAAWYRDRGTLQAVPMVAADPDDAAVLTRLARAMLGAEGSLTGPELDVGGRVFQAGDQVIATAEVPGGPPAGAPGTVTVADPDLGAVRVDFPTWGMVRASTASALARSLDHDYASVREPEVELALVDFGKEFERLGIGVEP